LRERRKKALVFVASDNIFTVASEFLILFSINSEVMRFVAFWECSGGTSLPVEPPFSI
jgi:hypothetical protein